MVHVEAVARDEARHAVHGKEGAPVVEVPVCPLTVAPVVLLPATFAALLARLVVVTASLESEPCPRCYIATLQIRHRLPWCTRFERR